MYTKFSFQSKKENNISLQNYGDLCRILAIFSVSQCCASSFLQSRRVMLPSRRKKKCDLQMFFKDFVSILIFQAYCLVSPFRGKEFLWLLVLVKLAFFTLQLEIYNTHREHCITLYLWFRHHFTFFPVTAINPNMFLIFKEKKNSCYLFVFSWIPNSRFKSQNYSSGLTVHCFLLQVLMRLNLWLITLHSPCEQEKKNPLKL